MPILDYALPCQLSSIDQRTNAVSLFNVIDTLSVVRHPGQSQQAALSSLTIEVVTCWRRLPDEDKESNYQQVISIIYPDGNDEELSTIDFKIPYYRYRVHSQILPLAFYAEGTYLLRVNLRSHDTIGDEVLTHAYPIQVELTDLPIVVALLPDELEALQRPIKGQGGFQGLLRRIQNQIVGSTLVLNETDAERLLRYADRYGQGGFQGRMQRIVQQVQEQLGNV